MDILQRMDYRNPFLLVQFLERYTLELLFMDTNISIYFVMICMVMVYQLSALTTRTSEFEPIDMS